MTSQIKPPLDFSLKDLESIIDCLEEDPRDTPSPGSKLSLTSPQHTPKSTPSPTKTLKKKRSTNAIRFSNNKISEWSDLNETMGKLLENPCETVGWIDFSFNEMTTIDECLLQYRNLKILYLHGNCIEKLSEVDKLAALPHLQSLTLHGNPIEEIEGYRLYVLSKIPQLKNFDFSGVTKSDRMSSQTWSKSSKRQRTEVHQNNKLLLTGYIDNYDGPLQMLWGLSVCYGKWWIFVDNTAIGVYE